MRRRSAARLALALAALLLAGCGDREDTLARWVPQDALLYLHVSTDTGDGRAEDVAERLAKLPFIQRLAARARGTLGPSFEFERDVRPWLGDEAAFALLDAAPGQASSLIVAEVDDEARARGFLTRVTGASGITTYRGVELRRFGPTTAALAAEVIVIGSEPLVRRALDRGPSIVPQGEPGVADAIVPADGVRRLLAPRVRSLDLSSVRGIRASLEAADDGLRVRATLRGAGGVLPEFAPGLLARVPEGALAYVGLGDLGQGLRALGDVGLPLEEELLEPLAEGAAVVTTSRGLPVLTFAARTRDEARTRAALGDLQAPLVQRFAPGRDAGVVPTFEQRAVGGTVAQVLRLAPGLEPAFAVQGGLVTASTAPAGLAQTAAPEQDLAGTDVFERVIPAVPDRVSAIGFLDLSQLLALGGRTGLTDAPAVRSLVEDLGRISAAGVVGRRDGPDLSLELNVQIP